MLSHASTHDPRLAMIHAETFLDQDRGRVRRKMFHMPFEGFPAGKRQVIRVARVPGVNRFR